MLKDITIGQYLPGESFVHKLDPRIKILMSFLFVIGIFLIGSFIGYGVIATFIIIVIVISGIKFRNILNGLKPIFFLIILTVILNVFMTGGSKQIFSFGFLRIYEEGLIQAVFIALRLILVIISTSLLTLTTSPIELTDGIEKLLSPFKRIGLPAHELAMMMSIALRFIPTLLDETDKIMKAQMARGADFESGNIINRGKNLIPLLVPLFVSSFRRADELAIAMESRCYKGGEGRTRMKQLKIRIEDVYAIIIMIVIMILAIFSKLIFGL
ncbi:MAG TPA: energy-coupling factor transporter transmembrane component T [Clostridiaceae bacterium]